MGKLQLEVAMTDHVADRFPTLPLRGAVALVAIALVTVMSARFFDIGTSRLSYESPIAERNLRFEDRTDGTVAVLAADNDELIALMEPGSNGFVRIVMRGLARDRQALGFGKEQPFKLTRWADGRLAISDPVTSKTILLTGFGRDNVNAFAKLLLAGSDAK
jgi:putative photosynthetic complex assembly protein